MAKKEKVSVYEWMVNPAHLDPSCSSCFYVNIDCEKCREISKINEETVRMFTDHYWIYEKFIRDMKKKVKKTKKRRKTKKVDIVNEVHDLLDGENNGEEKINK